MTKRRRRGKGEGSIYQPRGRTDWRAEIRVGAKRLVRYFKTQREAQLWLAQVRVEAARGLLPEPSKVTLGEYLTFWLENGAKPTVRPPTLRQYEYAVRVHLNPDLGGRRLQELKPADIQTLYSQKLATGLSRRSVQIIHAVLHRALKQAVEWGLLAQNPADRVKAPRPGRREFRVLTPEEAARFLEAARASEYFALFATALGTGLRLAELLGLRWSDIDFEAGTIQVRRTLCWVRGSWVEGEPKTAAGRRKVVLPPELLGILKEHKRAQAEAKLKAGPGWSSEYGDLVFSTRAGQPIPGQSLRRGLKQVLKRAGLPAIRFHDLRHTHATLLLVGGVNPRVVQERLGHTQVGITLGTYSHVLPDLQREAARQVGQALFKSPTGLSF
ncbi:MAG: site-specific integrase [Chloroflexota bacterium]